MKILKEGKWNERWSANMSCSRCESELEVDEEDLQAATNQTNKNFFTCPVCSLENVIDSSALPIRVLNDLNKIRRYCGGSGDPI